MTVDSYRNFRFEGQIDWCSKDIRIARLEFIPIFKDRTGAYFCI